MSPQMDFERLERHAATLQEVERNNDVTTDVIIPTVRAEAIEIALFPITINGLMIIEEEDESDDNGCRPSSSTAISETNAVDRTPTSAENSMTTTAGCPPSYNSVVVTAGRPTIQLAATTSVAAVTSNNDALLTFDRMQQHKRLSEAVPPGKQRGSFVTAIDHVTSDDQEDDQEDTESCRTVVSAADVEREFVSSSQNRKSKGLHYDRNGAPPPRYSDQSVVNKESAFSEKTVAGNERAREPSKQEALLITDAPTAVNAIGFISRDLIEIKRKCVLPMSMSSSIGDLSSVNSVLSRRNSQLVDWDNSADLVGYGGGAGSRSLDVGLLFDDVSTEPEALADELFDHIFAPSAVEVIRVVLDGSSNSRETDNASMTSSNSSSGLHPALLRSKASDNDSFNPNSSDSTSDSKKDGDRYGFSVSDGLYERGVFVSAVRPGSPAAHKNGLKLFDRILQVGDVITADMDCSQVAPLIARCQGNRVELIVCRRSTRRTRLRNCSTASSPWQRLPRKPALYPGMSSGPLPWKRRGAGGTRVKFYDECLRSTAL